jgi:hypothetical protein
MIVRKAAQDGEWSAAAWWLKSRHPETWGKRHPDVAVQVNNVQLTEAAGALAQRIQSVIGDEGRGLATRLRAGLNGNTTPEILAVVTELERLQETVTRRIAAELTTTPAAVERDSDFPMGL